MFLFVEMANVQLIYYLSMAYRENLLRAIQASIENAQTYIMLFIFKIIYQIMP